MSPQLSELKTLRGNLESLGSELAQMIQSYQLQREPRKEIVHKVSNRKRLLVFVVDKSTNYTVNRTLI